MSAANIADGVVTKTTGTDANGRALVPVTIGDTTLPPGSTPEQRFQAILKAGVQPNQGGHTSATINRLQGGDAARAVDQKALTTLQDQYSKLPAHDRETHRAAFEADLKAVYEGKAARGELKAALATAEREGRTRDALNAALREGKSPAELKQIIDDAASGTPKAAQVHITGDAAIAVLERGFASMSLDNQRAAQKVFERDYAAIRASGHAIRVNGNVLEVYDPASSREIAGQPRDASGRFASSEWSTHDADGRTALTTAGEKRQADLLAEYAALPDAEKTASTGRDYQVAIYQLRANADGLVGAAQFAARDLSGYRLPGGWYPPDTIHELAAARAAGISESQLDAFLLHLRTRA